MRAFIRNVLATAVLFLCTMFVTNAQTFQGEFSATWDEPVYALCLGEYLTGSFTYHVTYHVNKKTGYIDRVKWNVQQASLMNPETGKVYQLVDTGTDNIGAQWGFFAAVGAIPASLLPPVYPALPLEGTYIFSQFKWVSRGVAYKGSVKVQLHRNAAGELKARVVEYDLCF